MKKSSMLVGFLLASLSLSTIAATNTVRSNFAPLNWTSANAKDVITVQNNVPNRVVKLQVFVSQISVGNNYPPPGVNIQNCGSTTHINPGSSAICDLTATPENKNPVVTFSSDSEDTLNPANGVYQVQ